MIKAIYVHELSVALQVSRVVLALYVLLKAEIRGFAWGNAVSVHRGRQDSFSGTGLLVVQFNDTRMLKGFCLISNICIEVTIRSLF